MYNILVVYDDTKQQCHKICFNAEEKRKELVSLLLHRHFILILLLELIHYD